MEAKGPASLVSFFLSFRYRREKEGVASGLIDSMGSFLRGIHTGIEE